MIIESDFVSPELDDGEAIVDRQWRKCAAYVPGFGIFRGYCCAITQFGFEALAK